VETLAWLLDQADRHDFVIAADECYSEIYPDEDHPPPGLLEVAASTGRSDFRRCVVFHSLSKRSNLPGLRSGFVAGDATVLDAYFQYRTYEGCALGTHVQRASTLAWTDEAHVVANRALYRDKFAAVSPLLRQAFSFVDPDGGFYHWLDVGGDDQEAGTMCGWPGSPNRNTVWMPHGDWYPGPWSAMLRHHPQHHPERNRTRKYGSVTRLRTRQTFPGERPNRSFRRIRPQPCGTR
jgi:bifunctional pyridoxal-dependent enzyme with beta-cystathionase and maltose regulon repressor activities